MSNIIKDVYGGARALWKGLNVTFGYMFRKRFNVPYPDKKLPIPPRFRGLLRIKDKVDSPTAKLTWEQAYEITDAEGRMPPCMEACPNHQHARDYIRFIMQRQYLLGLQISRLTMSYPGVLGRVCTHPCEDACRMGEEGEPIAICQLKRFLADWARKNEIPPDDWNPKVEKLQGAERYHVGVIGAGPAGMTCAYIMARWGFRVTVYEKLPVIGGYLAVGIPPHRLPRDVLNAENETVLRYGVEVVLNCEVGKDISFDEIYEKHDAVMVATGAIVPLKMGIEGEDLEGVYGGEHYLKEVCLGRGQKVGKRVAVVGLGLTAMDCARVALRMGGEEVTFVYRRTKEFAPAPEHEIADAVGEGCKLLELVSPVRVVGENGKVVGLELQKMKLGERDASGRPRPVPSGEPNFVLPVDTILTAISRTCDYGFLPEKYGFEYKRNKTLVVDDRYMTPVEGVFAAGDGVIGPWTVISAIGQARFASQHMAEYLLARKPKNG